MLSPRRLARITLIEILVLAGLLFVVVLLLLPNFEQSRESARFTQCKNMLKQISLALEKYQDVHGSYPPAITYGPDGRPWHSWRALLMPHLEGSKSWSDYKLSEPWDGPHNRQLAEWSRAPQWFRCPSDDRSDTGTTTYVAVIGDRTMWPADQAIDSSDVASDEKANTLHVVEMSDSGVHWLEPRDLLFDDMAFTVNAQAGSDIRGRHTGRANALLTDGSVRQLPADTPPETVRSLLLRDDGGPSADW